MNKTQLMGYFAGYMQKQAATPEDFQTVAEKFERRYHSSNRQADQPYGRMQQILYRIDPRVHNSADYSESADRAKETAARLVSDTNVPRDVADKNEILARKNKALKLGINTAGVGTRGNYWANYAHPERFVQGVSDSTGQAETVKQEWPVGMGVRNQGYSEADKNSIMDKGFKDPEVLARRIAESQNKLKGLNERTVPATQRLLPAAPPSSWTEKVKKALPSVFNRAAKMGGKPGVLSSILAGGAGAVMNSGAWPEYSTETSGGGSGRIGAKMVAD